MPCQRHNRPLVPVRCPSWVYFSSGSVEDDVDKSECIIGTARTIKGVGVVRRTIVVDERLMERG